MISSDFDRQPGLQTHAQHYVCSQVCLLSKPLIGIQIFILNSLISSSISTFLKLNLRSLMKYFPSILPASKNVHLCMLLSLEINQDINKMINYKWAIKCMAITMKCKPPERKNCVLKIICSVKELMSKLMNAWVNKCMNLTSRVKSNSILSSPAFRNWVLS